MFTTFIRQCAKVLGEELRDALQDKDTNVSSFEPATLVVYYNTQVEDTTKEITSQYLKSLEHPYRIKVFFFPIKCKRKGA